MRPVLHVLGPSTGGIRRHVAVLAAERRSRGGTVRIAGPHGVMGDLWPDQIDVPIGAARALPAAIRQLRMLAAPGDVIVHAHGLKAGWTAVLAGLGPRTVVTVHNLVLDEAAGRNAALLRRLERDLPRRVAVTIAISEEVRRHLDPSGTDPRLHVIPPVGPEPRVERDRDAIRSELGLAPDRPLVVTVGRLHPQKDLDLLIDAAAELPDITFVVVGEGPERDRLEDRIRAIPGLDVRLIGERRNAADHLAAADVVVSSARWEGFGLAIAEALTLGRPVVATDVGPIHTMILDGRTGRLVPPGDPVALRDAISEMLSDTERARRLGEAGAAHIRRTFSADALVERTEDLYLQVPDRS